MAPAGTPREIIEKLRAEAAKAAANPTMRSRLLEVGIETAASASIEEFAAMLRKQVEDFTLLVKQTGLNKG